MKWVFVGLARADSRSCSPLGLPGPNGPRWPHSYARQLLFADGRAFLPTWPFALKEASLGFLAWRHRGPNRKDKRLQGLLSQKSHRVIAARYIGQGSREASSDQSRGSRPPDGRSKLGRQLWGCAQQWPGPLQLSSSSTASTVTSRLQAGPVHASGGGGSGQPGPDRQNSTNCC